MFNKKIFCITSIIIVLLFFCFGVCNAEQDKKVEKTKDITIEGRPFFINYIPSNNTTGTVVVGEKKILVYFGSAKNNDVTHNKMYVLIKSEMNDGDNQTIKIVGYQHQGYFIARSVEVEGYTFSLE